MTETNNDRSLRLIENAFAAVAALREREHVGDFSKAARETVREFVEAAYLSKPKTREAKRALARLLIACDLEALTLRDLEKIEEMGRALISLRASVCKLASRAIWPSRRSALAQRNFGPTFKHRFRFTTMSRLEYILLPAMST